METEAIDRLFLELSQFAKARTRRELKYEELLRRAQATCSPGTSGRIDEALREENARSGGTAPDA